MTTVRSNSAYASLAFDPIAVPDWAMVTIIAIPQDASPDPELWTKTIFDVRSLPPWVLALMGLRQAVVGLVGISKGGGSSFDIDKVVGDEALIFTAERHLDFSAAVGVDPASGLLRLTTAVKLHGWRGRLYFLPVAFLHDPVCRSMMRRAAKRLA